MSKQNSKADIRSGRPLNQCPEDKVAPERKVVKETRVDAPHALGPPACVSKSTEPQLDETRRADSRSKESANKDPAGRQTGGDDAKRNPTAAGEAPPDEQLRLQAAQLGEQLRRKQRDLDGREARLNARAARLENEARTIRLWFTESRSELDEREKELQQKTAQLQESQKRLAEAEAAVAGRAAELDDRAERLAEQTRDLDESRRQFDIQRERDRDALTAERQQIDTRRQASLVLVRQALAGLERRREQTESQVKRLLEKAARPNKELLAREEKSRVASEQYRRRMQQVLEAEESLAAQQAEVGELHRRFLSERDELQRRDRHRREQAATERAKMEAELANKRRRLVRRSEELDREQSALRHLRAELSEMHRAALEMRLATEELWMRLSGAIPPATLTLSLCQIRSRLAENYRAEKAELAERKRELVEFGADLAGQLKHVSSRKAELDAWIARRGQEIEQQAARLVTREQELHDQETRFEEAAQEWADQRLAYQQEIRRLREQLDELAESGKISSGMCGVF